MPNFIQFNEPEGTVVNIKYLTGLSKGMRVVKEVEAAKGRAREGQHIYYIRYSIAGGSGADAEFNSEQYRDECFNEIMATIRPTLIGGKAPTHSVPAFVTPINSKEAEVSTESTPTPKPPRKPTTRKPRE